MVGIMDWFMPPGGDPMAAASMMGNPESLAATLAAAGVPPPDTGPTPPPQSPIWWANATASPQAAGAPPPMAPPSPSPDAGMMPSGGAGLAGALKGVTMPQAPSPHFPNIGSPGAYRPSSQIDAAPTSLINLMAGAQQHPDVLTLLKALGGR